jgi:hypothetical protein
MNANGSDRRLKSSVHTSSGDKGGIWEADQAANEALVNYERK